MKIKFILVYYTKSRYLGMKKQHVEIFKNMEELVNFRNKLGNVKWEVYKQVL